MGRHSRACLPACLCMPACLRYTILCRSAQASAPKDAGECDSKGRHEEHGALIAKAGVWSMERTGCLPSSARRLAWGLPLMELRGVSCMHTTGLECFTLHLPQVGGCWAAASACCVPVWLLGSTQHVLCCVCAQHSTSWLVALLEHVAGTAMHARRRSSTGGQHGAAAGCLGKLLVGCSHG